MFRNSKPVMGYAKIHVHEKQEERLKMRQSEPEELTLGVAGHGEPLKNWKLGRIGSALHFY